MKAGRVVSPPRSELKRLRTPLTEGETAVFELLDEHLDEEWEIYIQPHLNGIRPDFVLLHKVNGICVLEVKDWALGQGSYRFAANGSIQVRSETETDKWARVPNPFEQLFRYKCEIADLYCPSLDEKHSLSTISASLVLPNTSQRLAPELKSLRDRSGGGDFPNQHPIAFREDLEQGDVARVFPLHRRPCIGMNEQVAGDLRHWLVEPEVSAEQRRPLELDAEQRRLASTRTESGYRRIKGAAGSGKSQVLAARAAQICDAGGDVLFVTFNITLLNYLRDLFVREAKTREALGRVTWVNFHHYCKRLAAELGVFEEYQELWRAGDAGAVLRDQLATLLTEAITDVAPDCVPRYQGILVDEGQDYRISWWQLLRALAEAAKGEQSPELVLAADATQDLYGTARAWTDRAMEGAGFSGRWATLEVSYRMPPGFVPRVRAFAERYLPLDEFQLLPLPAQAQLDLYPYRASWFQVEGGREVDAMHEAIREALAFSDKSDPLAMADLTVICGSTEVGRRMRQHLEKNGIRVESTIPEDENVERNEQKRVWAENRRRKVFFFKGDARVKLTTIHSFKGWESRFIVVQVDEKTSAEVLYAALTRLKRHALGSSISVVCSAPRFASYGATWSQATAEV